MASDKSSLEEKNPQLFSFILVELEFEIMKKQNNIVSYNDLQSSIMKYLVKLPPIKQRKKIRTNQRYNIVAPINFNLSDQDCQEKNKNSQSISKTHIENVLNDFFRYNKGQPNCIIIFDVEQVSNEEFQKTVMNNFDRKMPTEGKFFEFLNVLFSQPKSNVVTLGMFEEAVRVAGPNVRIFFERARRQSSTVKLGYVVHFPDDCRLLMHIPIIRGSELEDKEQIYLEEHPRFNPNSVNGTRRQCS